MTELTNLAARKEMVAIARRMNASGINQGTAGNLSLRVPEGFLITPTSLPYDRMEADDIVEMAFDGTYVGKHRPSSEWRFHRDILKARTDINVVLHCHSIYATTLACQYKPIPAFHYMVGVAGGTTIRVAKYATFGTQQLSDNAIEALRRTGSPASSASTARSRSARRSRAPSPSARRWRRWRGSTSRC